MTTETKTAHTPGPWTDDTLTNQNPTFSNGAMRIVTGDGARIAFLPMWQDDEHQEARANARLIAAAPELLSALNAMLTHMGMDEDEWNRPTFNQARRAVAKATGVGV